MTNISQAFIKIALLWLLAGMLLGLYMGAAANNSFLDVHIAMLLPGAVILTLYGVIYRLWPSMASSSLARVQFWIANIGELGLVVGAFLMNIGAGIVVVAGGSVLVIIGAALMAWTFWTQADA